MSERCVDASVAIKWAVSSEADHDKADVLLRESETSGIILTAPPLFPTELDSYVRQRVHNGSLTPEEEQEAYAFLDTIPMLILEPEGRRLVSHGLAALSSAAALPGHH